MPAFLSGCWCQIFLVPELALCVVYYAEVPTKTECESVETAIGKRDLVLCGDLGEAKRVLELST